VNEAMMTMRMIVGNTLLAQIQAQADLTMGEIQMEASAPDLHLTQMFGQEK